MHHTLQRKRLQITNVLCRNFQNVTFISRNGSQGQTLFLCMCTIQSTAGNLVKVSTWSCSRSHFSSGRVAAAAWTMRSITKPASAEQWSIKKLINIDWKRFDLTLVRLQQTFQRRWFISCVGCACITFYRTSGFCFVLLQPLLPPPPPLLLISVTHGRFCLSCPVLFFIALSETLFRHLAVNNTLQFPSLLVKTAAVPPSSRRWRISAACVRLACGRTGRHVIFWHTWTEPPQGSAGKRWECNASPSLSWPFHTSCCWSLIAHSPLHGPRRYLATEWAWMQLYISRKWLKKMAGGAYPPPTPHPSALLSVSLVSCCRRNDESRWEERLWWMHKGKRQPLSGAFEGVQTRNACGIPQIQLRSEANSGKRSWVWFKL